ncbi:MipA/OmpV family protein [Devosia sp. 1635]|uniref:MipA/OmpV family protein n=1 Tax=Devosia sp. 1635 TaxID=2726066 RepID=UPI001567966F
MRHDFTSRLKRKALLSALVLSPTVAQGADFDSFGAAATELVAIETSKPDLIFELGLGVGTAPIYPGSTEYGMTVNPIIRVERLNIPGLIDIGGEKSAGGLRFGPSFAVQGERISSDHEQLLGLDDVDTTYEVGGRVGYEFIFSDVLSTELYGQARYAFGGAEGLVGEVGLDATARLTPQLEVVGGVYASMAGEDYVDTYFGVTAPEAIASGGRLDAYDPGAGVTAVGVKLAARYEFIPDTFFNASAEYSRLVADAADSPVVQLGTENQFVVGVGLSRRFSFNY